MADDLGLVVADSGEMELLGGRIARALVDSGGCVTLSGQLGAGKTTLVRGALRGLGYGGVVKSPTYTLMEEYPLAERRVFHLDLYRLADAEELEYLGLRDALVEAPLIFVEWPDRGSGGLPEVDLAVRIEYREQGRRVCLQPLSPLGGAVLNAMDRR